MADLAIFTVAVDFDGTIADPLVRPLRWLPGAREFLLAAPAAGIRLILHSRRCAVAGDLAASLEAEVDALTFWRTGEPAPAATNQWNLFEEMREFLIAGGVWGLLDVWAAPGKPDADVYVDDKAERPDWLALARELGVALGHADQGGDRAVVGGRPIAAVAPPAATASAAPAPGPTSTAPGGVRVQAGSDLRRDPGPGGSP